MIFNIYEQAILAFVSELGRFNVTYNVTDIFDSVYLCCAQNAQRVHLCAELTAASWMFEPSGEIDANLSLQLSSQTQIAKIKNKKVIPENQCEKHKKLSLAAI